jgi:hypothetical protein
VDSLVVRANPQRIADDVKAQVVAFVTKPPVLASLAGSDDRGVLVIPGSGSR